MTLEQLYIVHWRSLGTQVAGNGSPLPLTLAQEWVDKMNATFNGAVEYWIEPAPDDNTEATDE